MHIPPLATLGELYAEFREEQSRLLAAKAEIDRRWQEAEARHNRRIQQEHQRLRKILRPWKQVMCAGTNAESEPIAHYVRARAHSPLAERALLFPAGIHLRLNYYDTFRVWVLGGLDMPILIGRESKPYREISEVLGPVQARADQFLCSNGFTLFSSEEEADEWYNAGFHQDDGVL